MSEDMLQDVDPLETQEWVDALQAVLEQEGPERAHFLLEKLIDKARRNGTHLPYNATTLSQRVKSLTCLATKRWNVAFAPSSVGTLWLWFCVVLRKI